MTPAMGYTRMKDSGIPWIGEVPAHWEIRRNKTVFSCNKAVVGEKSAETQLLSLTTSGIKMKSMDATGGKIPESYDTYQYVHKDDIVMCLFDLDCSAVFSGISAFDGMISPAYKVLQCNDEIEPRYADYWFRSVFDGRKFKYLAKNIRYSLTYEDFSALALPYPSIEEQKGIASYLDSQCAKIDEIIAEAKASIEDYKQWKASVIYEAVTKGLDPDVEMKESGVEWIGEIPSSWRTRRIKAISSVVRGGSPRPIDEYLTDSESGVNWIKINDTVKGQKYITAVKQKIIPDGVSKSRKVHKGDLLLTNSMSFGEPYILDVDGCIHDGWVSLTALREVTKEFLYYFLLSPFCLTQFQRQVAGGVVQNLNVEKIGTTTIFLPPLREQEAIVFYLDAQCNKIDTLIREKQSLISDLESYKKSLIYEVVTGKKKVV